MPHHFHSLSDHVYWFTPDARTDRPILGAVVGERATLIVDAGASPSHAKTFLAALEKEGIPFPDYLALTHWHWDHVFGISALDVPVFAQRGTAEQIEKLVSYDWSNAALDARVKAGLEIAFCRDMIKLELPERRNLRLRTPDIIFSDDLSIDLGGVTCELHHVGGDHAEDSSVLYVPEDKVLFLGDCMSQAIYSPRHYYSSTEVLALFDKLDVFDAAFYLESHNENALSREDFQGVARALRAAAHIADRFGNDPKGVRNAVEHHTDIPSEEAGELTELFLNYFV